MKSTQIFFRACFGVALVLAFSGCQTVQQPSVVSWREAIQATKEQSRATFETVGLLVRESELSRIETLPPDKLKQISESDVAPALPPQAVRQWNLALDAMAAYASSVETLISPDLPQGIGDSLKRTGEQIGATADVALLKSDKELSKAMGSLGQQIVAAAANRKARDIMLQVDPSIKQLTERMADMLYQTRPGTDEDGKAIVKESGVLPTVRVTWQDKITAVQEKFRDTTDGAGRRALAEQYIDLLDRQTELEDSILALRRGILDLGAAHTAAAQGRAADLRTLVASMHQDIEIVREIASSLKKKN